MGTITSMPGFPVVFGFDARSLTVVAPHPDDDVLGCGALIARVAPRMDVHVIYVTDGAASHGGSRTYPPRRLRDVREREARRGLHALGVATSPLFLRWPDGTVPNAADPCAGPLLAALDAAIPDGEVAVAAPWRRDPHRDHRAVYSLVRAVLDRRPRALCVEYPVWTGTLGGPADAPLPGEGSAVELETGPWLRAKTAALHEHRSQRGVLINDAATAFVLPDDLVRRALGPVERFVVTVRA